jgi:hypothetical protein
VSSFLEFLMHTQLTAFPDDVDLGALAAAIKQELGLLLLAPGVSGLASLAVSPTEGMLAMLAMTTTLLLGLAFVSTRELLALVQRAPTSRRVARTQADFLVSAMHSRGLAAAPSVTTVRKTPSVARRFVATSPDRAALRNLVAGEAGLIDADELIRQLARQRIRASCSTNPRGFLVVPKRSTITGMTWLDRSYWPRRSRD